MENLIPNYKVHQRDEVDYEIYDLYLTIEDRDYLSENQSREAVMVIKKEEVFETGNTYNFFLAANKNYEKLSCFGD